MRAAIYARVSTADKDQNPETQLLPLREFAAAQGSIVADEFTDRAPATDLRARTAWRDLLDKAARRHVDLVLVWRIDRAFRSVLDAATTLERLRAWGVGLRSYTEPWLDTTSPFGEALYYITAAYAQLERGILAERVRAGMDRARRQGRRLGRPGGTHREGFRERWRELVPQIYAGTLSRRRAALLLGVSRSTILRLLDSSEDHRPVRMP
jgi:DNA invertase Pin-like site-specific DNA recombinase